MNIFAQRNGTLNSAVRHFVRRHNIVYHIGIHVSQQGKEEVAEEAADYVKYLHPQL